VTTASEDETGDSDRRRREELARWLEIELDRILRPALGDDRYRDAITEVAMFVLVDFLDHPEHRALPRSKDDPGSPTLYHTLAVTAPDILRAHVTDMMWETSTTAAEAVLDRLAAGG
jgi:hypothetical protein